MSEPGAAGEVAGDRGRLLWHLASAGAAVRRAQAATADWDPTRLDLGRPPRALLIAADPPAATAAALAARLSEPVAPTTVLTSPQLPRWAGASDAALVIAVDGRHPRLVAITEQAARRGVMLAVVAPAGSPVAVAAGRGVVVDLPADSVVRAAGWGAFGPTVLALGAWGLTAVGSALLPAIADALDEVAHACRPASDVVANPARALAEEFTESLPVIVGVGPLANVAADRIAAALRLLGGVGALALHLPDDLAEAGALLAGAGPATEDDFFRDRTEDDGLRPRVVLVGDEGRADDPALGVHDGGVENEAGEHAALAAAEVVHRAAAVGGVRASTLDVPGGDPLARFAAAVLLGEFTGVYLALERGLDPSAPRPGELE